MLLLIYDLCSAASWLLCIKTYKSKRSQIYFTDKYLHAASYTNSTMKNGLKSFTFPRYPSHFNTRFYDVNQDATFYSQNHHTCWGCITISEFLLKANFINERRTVTYACMTNA